MTVLLIVIGVALAMLAIEYVRPARRWPTVATWWPRALALNAFQIAIVIVGGATWERWLHGASLLGLSSLPLGAELAIGYFAYVLWLYASHRLRHHVPFIWRWFHQVHHSPARIEILTSFYKHPLEIVVESILGAALFFPLLGISREAAFIAANISGVLSLFYHWNISTPQWLGYIIQRPESHCVHHEQNVHAFNYSELPIIDIVFGTFKNPARFDGRCGLGDGEQRFGALLAGRDVAD